MTTPLFNEEYLVVRTDKEGQPIRVVPFYTNLGTYVGTCLHLLLALFREPIVRKAFEDLAHLFCPQSSKSWRENLSDSQVVDIYFEKNWNTHPTVFVNDAIGNEDFKASTNRRIFSGTGYDYHPEEQGININGPLAHKMCVSGTRAENTKDPNSKHRKRFQVHLFQLTKTLLHEHAHLFITFLGLGHSNTPPQITVLTQDENLGSIGESGRWLESRVFGGLVIVLRDEADDDEQAGIVYLINYRGTHKILDEDIDNFLKFNFSLPITRIGEPMKPGMQTLGRHDMGPPHFEDPTQKFKVSKLYEDHVNNPPRWDETVLQDFASHQVWMQITPDMDSILREVPFNPKLRLLKEPA